MMTDLLIGLMAKKLPEYNPSYCFHLAWMFEEDNKPIPNEEIFKTARAAMDAMANIWNTPKTLVHISLSRRNA